MVKLGLVDVGSNNAQNHSSSPYEVISDHYLPHSYEKLIKNEIMSSWSRFEHCSKSLVQPIGSHIWSLLASIQRTRHALLYPANYTIPESDAVGLTVVSVYTRLVQSVTLLPIHKSKYLAYILMTKIVIVLLGGGGLLTKIADGSQFGNKHEKECAYQSNISTFTSVCYMIKIKYVICIHNG